MTAQFMVSIYNALRPALSPVAVFRAWPQVPAYLPGCSFRLLSWERLESGAIRTLILVTLRANSPEANDAYSATVQSALTPLALALSAAEDAVENDTGFFLRNLTFTHWQNQPPAPEPPTPTPEEQYPLIFRMYDTSLASWLTLPGPLSFDVRPASRQPAITGGITKQLIPLSPFQLSNLAPGSITIRAPFSPASLIVSRLQDAFNAGSDISFSLAYRSADHFRNYGSITALSASPLGIELAIAPRSFFVQV